MSNKNKEKKSKLVISTLTLIIIFVLFFIYLKYSSPKPPTVLEISTAIPQFVLLSFDGSKSVDMWKKTIDFADFMNANGKPLHFTYFINSAYFLAPENAYRYTPPSGEVGNSAIGFAEGINSINERIKQVNRALDRGNEIGSHAAGHFSGGYWSVEEWQKEFGSFKDLLFNTEENNPQMTLSEPLKLSPFQIKGFRAPNLSINDNMYTALSLDGFTYDSSEVSLHPIWPWKDKNGIWHVPISTAYFPVMGKSIIAVDYSIWVSQTNNLDILKKGTKEWLDAEGDVVNAYMNYFDKSYSGNRAPIVIDNHFSAWNDGLYFEAMKEFAMRVCGKPDVHCSTFSDLIKYVETNKK